MKKMMGLLLILSILVSGLSVQASDKTVICSFSGEASTEIVMDEKGTVEDVVAVLPETLEVYTKENEAIALPVTWECQGDYENTNYFYYQFVPKWDETTYSISEEAVIPSVWVLLYENQTMAKAVTSSSNESTIYNFLVDNLGCNMATAVGILANIERESSYNPEASVEDTNGLTSYGICQWNGSRFTALKSYCEENGYTYSTLEGQLNYLKYELSTSEKSAWNKMQGIENTAVGAYTAGYYWAQYFERCAAVYREVSAKRARDVYWPEYSNETVGNYNEPVIAGANVPSVLTTGNVFSIRGLISCNNTITGVTVACYDVDGKAQISESAANLSVNTYNVSNLDANFEFNKLEPGIYYYRITATVSGKETTLVNSVFTVLAKSATIASGTYVMTPHTDENYAVGSVGTANIALKRRENSDAQKLVIKHLGSGYYSIQIAATGNVFTSAGTTAGSDAKQAANSSADSQKWQILPAGDSYCLVPKNAASLCLGTQETKVGVFTPTLSDTQRFAIQIYDANWKPVNPFTDVKETDFYYNPVLWAYGKGIANGTSATIFEPGKIGTRGDVVTFLWRAAGSPKPTNTVCPFEDVPAYAYYYDAVLWAVENNITGGTSQTTFEPSAQCTRGQVVTFLWRLAGKEKAANTENLFVDVENYAYYYDAVLWAVENDITAGSSTTTFAPNDACTRGQIVTFLYRYYN